MLVMTVNAVTVPRGNVSKPAEVDSITKPISEKFGRIGVLFANAGLGLASSIRRSPVAPECPPFASGEFCRPTLCYPLTNPSSNR
jgi:NAD(P)-dependent dehydrogenase (short-subunit alcohol dehydrogenase family)